MKAALVTLLLALAASFAATAKTYYLDDGGSDLNDGLRPSSAWRTLERLQEAVFSLEAGDSILFARGSCFRGNLSLSCRGSVRKPVYVGTWGSGPLPVITGAVELTQWKTVGKNLWRARWPFEDAPGDLFISGVRQPLGRYPNEGYRTITSSANSNTFSDGTLVFRDGDLDGAEVVVKSERWTIDRLRVLSYERKTFQYLQRPSYPLTAGAGYFIQDHPATLDRHGEWCFLTETNEVFLYSETDPNNLAVEASALDRGLTIADSRHVIIADLVVRHIRTAGIVITHSDSITLDRITLSGSAGNGLVITDCRHPTVRNVRVTDSHNNGVEWRGNTGGLLENSRITRSGLTPGRGYAGNGNYIGLSISGDAAGEGNVIQDNMIDSTGYNAIDFRSDNTVIRSNTILYFCLIKDDGGGIYTWGSRSGQSRIDNNTILYGVGCGEGTVNAHRRYVAGIYIDDRSQHISLTNNTVSFCAGPGITLHNATGIDIEGNRLSHNARSLTNDERAELLISRDGIVPEWRGVDLRLTVKNNVFVTGDEAEHCLYVRAERQSDLYNLGVFSANQYFATQPRNAVTTSYPDEEVCEAFESWELNRWQRQSGTDAGSVFTALPSLAGYVKGGELIANGHFVKDIEGWYVWPQEASIRRESEGRKGMLTIVAPEGDAALVYYPGLQVNAGKIYRLTFKAESVVKSRLEFVMLEADAPWRAVGPYTCFAVDSTTQTFTWFFRPRVSTSRARLNFKTTALCRISDVSLCEVVPVVETPTADVY